MFCWGDASRGQLPVSDRLLTKPTFLKFPDEDEDEEIISVSCGEHHTLFLSRTGRVFSCGRNSRGQLGRAKSRDSKLSVVEGVCGVLSVVCGQEHSVVVCEDGQLFSWGGGGEGQLGFPSPVSKCPKPGPVYLPSLLPLPVVQVACGHHHSLALTKGGELYSWGQNKFGQLGLGREAESLQPTPALVQCLTGVPLVQVSAGGDHSLLLTSSAQVFCCGANNTGQLGLNRTDQKGRFTVCEVPALRGFSITSISCGAAHTAVLTQDGQVFTFGDGSHGQLGHNSTNMELLPRRVEGIDEAAKQVTCGSHHTLVLLASGGVYWFGCGVSAEESLRPVKLDQPWRSSDHTEIRISSGWNSNFLFFPPPGTSVLRKPVGKLDEEKVQSWISAPESEEAKREIFLTFSTSSNLVACFLKRCEAAGRRSPGTMMVDLDAASQTFDKLMKIAWIKKAINFGPLLKILFHSAPVMKSPEVFLLLPMCPALHEDQAVITTVLPLAVTITNLHKAALKTLKDHWSSLEAEMMMKHVNMWKHALGFLLKTHVWRNFMLEVKAVLDVLKFLYRANRRAEKKKKLHFSEFYMEELRSAQLLQEHVTVWIHIRCGLIKEEGDKSVVLFCRYPFLLDLQSKITVYHIDAEITKTSHSIIHDSVTWGLVEGVCRSEAPPPVFLLKVRRTALLEDTFRQLSSSDHDNFKKQLLVKFVDDAKLTEVHKRDFFLHVFNELVAPESEMFMYNDTHTLIWFPSQPKVEPKRYFLFGILCGLAFNNSNMVYLPFPLALFKKLLNIKPDLEDVIEFTPVIGESLRYLLYDYTDDDVENMELSFCVHWDGADVELDSQQQGKTVTSANKRKFVELFVDLILNSSVERPFEEFRRGLFTVCERDTLEIFQPEELRGVMVGTEQYDWYTLRQNTVYEGQYHARHPTILFFWEVFEELTEEQKKAFLLFLTGSDRVPVLGMKQVKMSISVLLNSTEDHLPESLTCHYILMLPQYSSRERLQDKLTEALSHNRGFWRE